MSTGNKHDSGAAQGARRATGQAPEPPQEPDTRNQAAVTLSKLGASKGGKARAESLSAAKRKAIAKKGAAARWKLKSR